MSNGKRVYQRYLLEDGAFFMVENIKPYSLDYIVKRLDTCAVKHLGCEFCKDNRICIRIFDARCEPDIPDSRAISMRVYNGN